MHRYHLIHCIAASLLTAFVSPAVYGDEKSETFESHFDTGISPDGRTEITVLSKAGEFQEELYLRITDTKSGRLLGNHPFDGFSFALHSEPTGVLSRDDVECLWRSDSRCVALSYAMARGFVGTTVYGPRGNHWVHVPLPEFSKEILKISRAAGETRVVFGNSSHGHESGVKWLPRNRFRLEAGYGGIQSATKEEEIGFWVTFRVIDGTAKSKPRILLEKVEFEPDPAR